MKTRPTSSAALLAAALLLSTTPFARAADGSWTGLGPNGQWNEPLNWTNLPGATTGSTNTDIATFNAAVTPFMPVLIDAGRNLRFVRFTENAGAYTIGEAAGPALTLTSGGSIALLAAFTGANTAQQVNAPLTLAASGTNGAYSFTNDSTPNTNTLLFGGTISGGVASGVITLTLNGTNTGTNTINAAIANGSATGGLAVVKSGAGTWTLSGENTFSGGLTLSQGRLNLNHSSAAGTGTFRITGGNIGNTTGSPITLTGGGAKEINGSFGLVSGTLDLGTGGVIISGTNRFIDTATGSHLIFSSSVSGTGKISKSSAGTLTLSASNTFAGGFLIQAGTLNINHSSALGTGTLEIAGGTLRNSSGADIALTTNNAITLSNNLTFSGPHALDFGGGAVAIGSGNRYINVSESRLNLGGAITGTSNVIKEGSGELTLGGNNAAWSGSITFNQGTLGLAHAGALGTGTLTFSRANPAAAFVLANRSGATLTLSSPSAITLATGFEFDGDASLHLGSAPVTMSGVTARELRITSHTLQIGGAISGTGGVNKSGSGTLHLSGVNTYSGTTTVTAGALLISGSHIGAGAYTVQNSGTLAGSGTIISADNAGVTLNQGSRLAPGALTEPGTLTLHLGTGTMNLAGAIEQEASQSLHFRLSATGNDSVHLVDATSTLSIGDGLLEFDDFVFTLQGTLASGTHTFTLFDTASIISGAPGLGLSGWINGHESWLSLGNGGSDLLLTVQVYGPVIPEPSSLALIGLAGGLLIRHYRRVRRTSV